MSNNGERFARLFRGYTARYGRYDLAGKKSEKGKEEGQARTVDQEITEADYTDHVLGNVGIGVIPLREDNLVNFAAIDVDVYNDEEKKKRKLTHEDVALALMETPLIVTQSKSMGVHVWMFSKEGVSARLASDYLNAQAAKLGCAGTEVFPKQTERVSDEDIGNWINLPYFGGTRVAVVPSKQGSVTEYIQPTLEQFLDIAEGAAEKVTDDFLIENTKLEPSQREGGESTKQWFDGPPCLQALIAGHPEKRAAINKKFERGEITEDQRDKQLAFTYPQLSEGARDNTFFNVGIYLRRRMNEHDTDAALDKEAQAQLRKDLEDAHNTWGQRLFGDDWSDPDFKKRNGIESDLPRIAKQAGKGKWGYKCTQEPLKGFCNRRLCLKRKFGVGTAINDQARTITGFTIVNTADKQYYMNVGDTRIHIPDVESLMNQAAFGKIILNETDRMWIPMQDVKYKEMMDGLLQNADVIEGPPDSDRVAVLFNALHEFVHEKRIDAGQSDAAIFSGRVLWTEDGLEAWFKFDQFTEFLRNKGVQLGNNKITDMLINQFGVRARGNTHVGGRQIRPYVVNLKHLEQLANGNG